MSSLLSPRADEKRKRGSKKDDKNVSGTCAPVTKNLATTDLGITWTVRSKKGEKRREREKVTI
jgi:hypothetical protein